jgi:hypothetical protein
LMSSLSLSAVARIFLVSASISAFFFSQAV